MTDHAELSGRQCEFDCKGYLIDFTGWGPPGEGLVGRTEKDCLNREHEMVLVFLRNYFKENTVHPVVRMITTEIAEKLGRDKGSIKCPHTLFSAGIHQTFMIAGLSMKHSCC